jgi:two-component system sensor histidine kinase TctE
MKSTPSLRFTLLIWLVNSFICIAGLSTFATYRIATTAIDKVYDEILLNSADSVLARMKWHGPNVSLDLPPAAQAILCHNDKDKFFYEVSESDGTFLSGDPVIPGPQTKSSSTKFYSDAINGEPVRIVKICYATN